MLSCVKAKICRFRCLVPLRHSPTLAQLTVIQQQEDSSFLMRLRLITQALQEDASTAQVSIPPAFPSSFLLTVGSYSLEFVKKSWDWPGNFPNLEKVCKIEISSGKIGFFLKLQQVPYKWIFFVAQILFNLTRLFAVHHGKSFVPASFFKVLIDHLSEGDALKIWWCWRENNRDVVVGEKNSWNVVVVVVEEKH